MKEICKDCIFNSYCDMEYGCEEHDPSFYDEDEELYRQQKEQENKTENENCKCK